ncbi:flagellar biosynthesis protein FliQ [Phreatobacter sp.]|uniref:flagellar biosynthesis protein FliQ n=1 Tax=Phreatobacter sp. TaxID=1966341 RepID=UPI0022C9C942|nr:flagellar biosynthesis protein FliQ [Phreatobacter sp.]MCZ8314505.1 flagellar biosynthesis protein FliQ [Phreatobacter sp.]
MNPADILDIARDGILTVILVSAPLMVVGLVVGVIVSLIQALTQIQEQTLVFVPKILAIFATMIIALPFMGDMMNSITARIMAKVVSGG